METGVTTRNELLQVRLRRQELASQQLQIESASRVLTMLLAQQIGLSSIKPEQMQLIFPEQQADVEMPVYVDSYSASLTRVESQLANKVVEANEIQIKLERGKLLPTLAVGLMGYNAGLGGLSKAVKDNMQTNMTSGIALATVSVPISAWFGGSHAVRKAKIKHEQSLNNRQNTIEKLAIDNETAWTNLQEAYRQIGIACTNVEDAEENLRMATDMCSTGKQTISDLLDAETLNRQARSQISNAIATYYIRLADYRSKVD